MQLALHVAAYGFCVDLQSICNKYIHCSPNFIGMHNIHKDIHDYFILTMWFCHDFKFLFNEKKMLLTIPFLALNASLEELMVVRPKIETKQGGCNNAKYL